jgi:hypothetical protein
MPCRAFFRPPLAGIGLKEPSAIGAAFPNAFVGPDLAIGRGVHIGQLDDWLRSTSTRTRDAVGPELRGFLLDLGFPAWNRWRGINHTLINLCTTVEVSEFRDVGAQPSQRG